MSEQFQNPIKKLVKRGKLDSLKHIYMTAHFPDLVQTRQ